VGESALAFHGDSVVDARSGAGAKLEAVESAAERVRGEKLADERGVAGGADRDGEAEQGVKDGSRS
jgi:hypothetical protein